MVASPLKSCTSQDDPNCPTNFKCELAASQTLKEAASADIFATLIYGTEMVEWNANCASQKGGDNKLFAEVLAYYTGTEQSATVFGFCIPDIDLDFNSLNPDEIAKIDGETENYVKVKIEALEAFSGKLPGVSDQKDAIIVFPPSATERYTWPQDTARRVQWVTFNMPEGTAVTGDEKRESLYGNIDRLASEFHSTTPPAQSSS